MHTAYCLQLRSRNPTRLYVGKTTTSRKEIRLQEQIDGGWRAAAACSEYGVAKLIYWEDVYTAMDAEALEHVWAHDLCFVFEQERVRISNGIERWSINGKLYSNYEITTSSRDYPPRFDYDRLPPRDLLKQRAIWRERIIHPLRIYNLTLPYKPPQPIPIENQLRFQLEVK